MPRMTSVEILEEEATLTFVVIFVIALQVIILGYLLGYRLIASREDEPFIRRTRLYHSYKQRDPRAWVYQSLVHICYLNAQWMFCNLEFRLLRARFSFSFIVRSFHVLRHQCELNLTSASTYNLDLHQLPCRLYTGNLAFHFNSILFCTKVIHAFARRRRIRFSVSHLIQLYPLLSDFRLMRCSITNRPAKSQNDCTILFRSFMWSAEQHILRRRHWSFCSSSRPFSPDPSQLFCLSQQLPESPMRKFLHVSAIPRI